MATYHWTEESAEIEALAKQADAIEIAGCTDDGDSTERVSNGEGAHFWSVYFHFTPEWPHDPNNLVGAMCIADRDTLEQARAYAAELSAAHGLSVKEF